MKVQTISREVGDKGRREVIGLKILSLPKGSLQNLKPSWLTEHKRFITRSDERITIHTVEGDVVFHIEHAPGRYCLTCGEKLPDQRTDPQSVKCVKHVGTHGAEAVKSDRWPHGYMVANSYECTIEDQRNG